MCTSVTKPPYNEEDRIRLVCRVSSIEQKKIRFCMDRIPVGGEIVYFDKDMALRSRPIQQTVNARVVA